MNVTREPRGCYLKRGPSVPDSSTLTTWLSSHPLDVTFKARMHQIRFRLVIRLGQWQQIWKMRYYLSAHWLNGDVLLSNSAFFIFAVSVFSCVIQPQSSLQDVLNCYVFYNNTYRSHTCSLTTLKISRKLNSGNSSNVCSKLAISPSGIGIFSTSPAALQWRNGNSSEWLLRNCAR